MARYLLLLLLFARSAPSQTRAIVYTTAESTSLRLTPTDTLTFTPPEPTSEGKVYVFVDPRKTFQPFIGIGGALTDAAAETFAKLPAARQDELLQAYYSADRGIGYTLGRTNRSEERRVGKECRQRRSRARRKKKDMRIQSKRE